MSKVRTTKITVHAGYGDGSAEIQIDDKLNFDLENDPDVHEREAKDIFNVLYQNLPSGTMDHLSVRFAKYLVKKEQRALSRAKPRA